MEDAEVEHPTKKQKQEDRIVQRVFDRMKDLQENSGDSSKLKPEELTKFMRFMEFTRVIAASALLAATFGAGYEYLALAGVVDMSPARAVLMCACFFGSLFVWEIASIFNLRLKVRALVTIVGVIVVIGSAFGLDRWTISWRLAHPPDVTEIRAGLSNVTVSVQQLTSKLDKTTHWTADVPTIKEISPVPGYLKMKLTYHGLPVEQANRETRIEVAYYNKGSTYTHESTMRAGLFYVDFHGTRPPEHNPAIQTQARDALAKLDSGRYDIAPGEGVFNTYETGVLTGDMIDNMNLGTARIYLFGYTAWTNQQGSDHVNTCLWLQPSLWSKSYDPSLDVTKAEPTWHEC